MRKAKVSVAVAGVKESSHQVSSFCMRVSADGELFQSRDLHSRTESVQHEPKGEQSGDYRNMLSSANASSNLGALQSAPPSSLSDTKAVSEVEGSKPGLLVPGSTFAFATVIFGNDARFSLEAVVMGASLKARTKMDILCLHTHEITEVWRQSLASVGWRLPTVTHVEYSPRVYLKEGRFSSVLPSFEWSG